MVFWGVMPFRFGESAAAVVRTPVQGRQIVDPGRDVLLSDTFHLDHKLTGVLNE